MSNKKIVERYMEAYNEGNHEKILSCLTEDVIWEMPGFFNLTGKDSFDKEIANDAFVGLPVINTTRMVEEGNVIVAEGSVVSKFKNGATLDAVFCDVFHFENGKIKKLTSYVMDKNRNL